MVVCPRACCCIGFSVAMRWQALINMANLLVLKDNACFLWERCMLCGNCGAQVNAAHRFCSSCGAVIQKQLGANSSVFMPKDAPTYAGFWLRAVALFIDAALLMVLSVVVVLFLYFIASRSNTVDMELFLNGANGLGIIVSWLYYALLESSAAQATFGKRLLGLKVTDLAGNKISFARATGRYFGKVLSSLTLLIGYLLAGITQKKQALHDMLASTVVVNSNA